MHMDAIIVPFKRFCIVLLNFFNLFKKNTNILSLRKDLSSSWGHITVLAPKERWYILAKFKEK